MNHTRSIKEMLNIPTGSRNTATNSYSTFTDSQLFFGSQFWPENSQGTSQDVSLSSRNSQQSSEGSESKYVSSYLTKPLLFGEFKDRSKNFGILDKFQEDKKRASEKAESNFVTKELQQFWKAFDSIQQLVNGTQNTTAVCQSLLEKVDNFTSTFEHSFNNLRSDVSQQFETLQNKVTSQTEMLSNLEEKVQKNGEASTMLASNLDSITKSLESVIEDQQRKQSAVEEALKLLNVLVEKHSAKAAAVRVTDTGAQTSPELRRPICDRLPENKLEDTQLKCVSHKSEPPQCPSQIIGRKKLSLRGHRRQKKPLVLSQRSKCSVADENRPPLMTCVKQQKARGPKTVPRQGGLAPLCLKGKSGEERGGRGSLLTPLSCWSQDSNSSQCLPEMDPMAISGKLSSESTTGSPTKPAGLWQLFDMDSDSLLGF